MLLNNYVCPQCRTRLTRVSKWLGYCCESCKLAVTLIGKEQVRITKIRDNSQAILPLSDLCVSA
ncbi:MAG TPA: hypothetical protein V6D05_18440 [Stenomitos sp.]